MFSHFFNNKYVEYIGNIKRFVCLFKGHKWILDDDDPSHDMWGWGTCKVCNRRELL